MPKSRDARSNGPLPSTSPHVSPLARHRAWAVEQGLLTPRGAAEGYVLLKPCQLVGTLWPTLLTLNHAGTRLDARTLRRLHSEAFVTAAVALVRQVQDVQRCLKDLARQAAHLVQGRLPAGEPPPASAVDSPLPDDLVSADLLLADGALRLEDDGGNDAAPAGQESA
jgi:hypothetical protein